MFFYLHSNALVHGGCGVEEVADVSYTACVALAKLLLVRGWGGEVLEVHFVGASIYHLNGS